MHNELSRKIPDTDNASNLQDDISNLRAKLDQKRVEHMVKIRAILMREKFLSVCGRRWHTAATEGKDIAGNRNILKHP